MQSPLWDFYFDRKPGSFPDSELLEERTDDRLSLFPVSKCREQAQQVFTSARMNVTTSKVLHPGSKSANNPSSASAEPLQQNTVLVTLSLTKTIPGICFINLNMHKQFYFKIWACLCMKKFMTVIFIREKNWKQLKCPIQSIQWMWYVYVFCG